MASKKSSRSSTENNMMSDLPYKAMKDLADRLDLLKDGKTAYWRELAREMDYNSITVENFGLSATKPNGSPGYSLLLDMSNRGTSYDELVAHLKKLQLYEALVQLGYKEDVRIIKQPVSTPVMIGQKVELECRAEGVPRPKYMWFKGQTPLMDQRGPRLVIENIAMENSGLYVCRAENEANFVFSQWVEVKVTSPIPKKGPVPHGALNQDTPIINDHPQPQILEVGQKLFLTCQASGPGTLEYQWFRNGEALIYGTKQELVIPEVQIADQGVYVCCIKSNNGSSTLSKGAEIIVNHQQLSPFSPSPIPIGQPILQHGPHPGMQPANNGPGMFMPGDPPFHPPGPFPGPGGFPAQLQHVPVSHHIPVADPRFENLFKVPAMVNAASPLMSPSGGDMLHKHLGDNPLPPGHNPMHNGPSSEPPVSLATSRPCETRPIRSGSPVNGIQMLRPDHRESRDEVPMGMDHRDCEMHRPCSDKVALLIGNKEYHVKSLKLNTPEYDTQDLAGILRSADFKVVSLVNLTKKEMDDAVTYFTQLIGPNVYALFFFAGHGFEVNNMNYMMAVDCTKQKNPSYCVCAQMVSRMMQEKGAKLSMVLLDMCRVVAPQVPITDMTGTYEHPHPIRSYPGYHIYAFSCSPAEKAYEVGASNGVDAGLEGGQDQLGLVGKDNSIFVAALKEHLQAERGSLKDTVQSLLNATAKNVYKHKPAGVENQWQRPQISSNLAEDLSIDDPVDPTLLPEQQEIRSRRWKDAHTIPDATVISSRYGQLALRLHFRAEHTNVLIVQAEVLQGCLTETEIETMDMSLVLQERPVPWILASYSDSPDFQSPHMAVQKSIAKKNLLHFKIPDLQKITTPEVTLRISANYRWRDKEFDDSKWQFQSDFINYRMDSPLYGKVTAHEQIRLKQQQQQLQQQQAPPPPGHHFMSSGPIPLQIPHVN